MTAQLVDTTNENDRTAGRTPGQVQHWHHRVFSPYALAVALSVLGLSPFIILTVATDSVTGLISKDLHASTTTLQIGSGFANAGLRARRRRRGVPGAEVHPAQALPDVRGRPSSSPRCCRRSPPIRPCSSSVASCRAPPPVCCSSGALPPLILRFPPSKLPLTSGFVNIGLFGAIAIGPFLGNVFAERGGLALAVRRRRDPRHPRLDRRVPRLRGLPPVQPRHQGRPPGVPAGRRRDVPAVPRQRARRQGRLRVALVPTLPVGRRRRPAADHDRVPVPPPRRSADAGEGRSPRPSRSPARSARCSAAAPSSRPSRSRRQPRSQRGVSLLTAGVELLPLVLGVALSSSVLFKRYIVRSRPAAAGRLRACCRSSRVSGCCCRSPGRPRRPGTSRSPPHCSGSVPAPPSPPRCSSPGSASSHRRSGGRSP